MLIVVKEYKRRGLFDAYLDGRWLCRSHAPLLSAARVLLAEGIPPETPIMMRHQGSGTISLRSTGGGAAAVVVESSRWGRPVPARHENQQARPRPDLADDESGASASFLSKVPYIAATMVWRRNSGVFTLNTSPIHLMNLCRDLLPNRV